jgi:hypothetical protein
LLNLIVCLCYNFLNFHTIALLNSRTIFQRMQCKLLISYVVIYGLKGERPTNTNKSLLQELLFSIVLHIENILSFSFWVKINTKQELLFSIALHIENILSFSIWGRINTKLLHYIIIDKYYVNMNLFTIIVQVAFCNY